MKSVSGPARTLLQAIREGQRCLRAAEEFASPTLAEHRDRMASLKENARSRLSRDGWESNDIARSVRRVEIWGNLDYEAADLDARRAWAVEQP